MKSSHTMCIAFRNATILEDELFDDKDCILEHRQAVGYPILITPSGECLHYYRRCAVPDAYFMSHGERGKAKLNEVDLGPITLTTERLKDVLCEPEGRAVMMFASELGRSGEAEKKTEKQGKRRTSCLRCHMQSGQVVA